MNNKILKAISIGIATMMAMNPITALAEEISEGTMPEGTDTELELESESQSAEEQVAETAAQAEAAINWATVSGGDAVTNILDTDTGVQDGEVVVEGAEGNDIDLSAQAKDAAEEFAADGMDSLADAQVDADDAEQNMVAADAAADTAQGEMVKADTAADTAEEIADDAEALVEQANQDMQDGMDDITNAETVEDAQAAYDAVEQIKNDAQADFDEKKTAFDNAKKDYEDAVKALADLEAAYNNAVDSADDNADAAAEELQKAKELADKMEQAMQDAKAEVDGSAAGALEIIQNQEAVKDNTSVNWKAEDTLFISIMENYYLPEQMGIEGATVERIQGPDNDDYNYFTATCPDGTTRYFNFKMEDGSKSQIVIFEKREVEIKVWDDLDGDGVVDGVAADEYDNYAVDGTDETLTVEEVEEGKADGSIVEVEDDVVLTGDVTDTDILVEEGTESTENGEQDVTIDEESKSESFAYDEDGNLVKTVTADVTTITYTNASFDSQETFDDAEARDEAAAAKEAELEQANDGKDATVTNTESTVTDYTATVTYIPTFTETVEINKTYTNSKFNPFDTDSAQDALEKAKEEVVDDNDLHNKEFLDPGLYEDDYYLMGEVEFEDMNVETSKSRWKEEYKVTGTAKATYAKITTDTLEVDTLQGILSIFGAGNYNNMVSSVKGWVEENGGIFLEAKWFNFNTKTATVKYIAAEKISTAVASNTITDAEQSAIEEQIAQNNAQDNLSGRKGAADSFIIRDSEVTAEDRTIYSFSVDYLEKSATTTENVAILTETYGNAKKLLGQVIQNKNYLEKQWLLEESTDEGLKNFLENAQNLVDKYERLVAESQDAQAAVVAAQEKVAQLQREIEELNRLDGNTEQVAELEAQLIEAEAKLAAAQEKLADLNELDKDAQEELSKVVEELEKITDDEDVVEGDDTEEDTTEDGIIESDDTEEDTTEDDVVEGDDVAADDDTETEEEVVTPQAPVADTTVEDTTVNDNAGQNQPETVEIEDEEAPLANTPGVEDAEAEQVVVDEVEDEVVEDEEAENVEEVEEVEDVEEENNDDVVEIEDEEPALSDTVEIEDEETALADGKGLAEKMSWWWLLIVIVLGATGREMYKRHQEKKLAKAEAAENVEE